MTALAPILEAFFTDRLMTQRGASPHTIASYRDTFTLLLGYIHQQTGKLPAQLDLADLDPATIGAFLQQLETTRGNSPATRNARLAAVRSLFRYASLRAPEHAALIGRILAIQPKRTTTTIVSFLTRGELGALLAAPDRATWHGRRDHTLLVFAAQTGLRVSELTGLAVHDIHLGTGPHAYCRGKGRKDRATPLTPHTAEVLTAWLAEQHASTTSPLFATRAGTPLSRDAVEHLVTRHAATAARTCPTLQAKKITPHTLRHTAAMNLLHAGVDITVIALWLGHENPATTRQNTPTWRSRRRRSPALPRPTPQPDATSRPTNCWPSSASSDPRNPTRYAAPRPAFRPVTPVPPGRCGITACST
jgi:integrase/recombinase XerD